MAVVLASSSPRRASLLGCLGLPFSAQPSRVDESAVDVSNVPRERVDALARAKAQDVASRYPRALVLGTDTLVSVDGRPLGKPRSPQEAMEMLGILSGRRHEVFTGLCLVGNAAAIARKLDPDDFQRRCSAVEAALGPVLDSFQGQSDEHRIFITATIRSEVYFYQLSPVTMQQYVTSGEPLDKAGSYGIQGGGAALVRCLNGCYTNVVGLPLCAVRMLFESVIGWPVRRCPQERCRIGGANACLATGQ